MVRSWNQEKYIECDYKRQKYDSFHKIALAIKIKASFVKEEKIE